MFNKRNSVSSLPLKLERFINKNTTAWRTLEETSQSHKNPNAYIGLELMSWKGKSDSGSVSSLLLKLET